MIEVPKTIVIYPHKRKNPKYLLCWIPSESYSNVANNSETLKTLEKYHPNGIEIECSDKGFQEAGINLDTPSDEIRQTFSELLEIGQLPENRIVELSTLREYIQERAKSNLENSDYIKDIKEGRLSLSSNVIKKLKKPPKMKGKEKPKSVYQRFTAQQAQIEEK